MPQLGFKKYLAPKILSGEKPFTLRDLRADGKDARSGQTLFMYTGLRSKECSKIAEKPCRFAVNVSLTSRSIKIPSLGDVEGLERLEIFAKLDGFGSHVEFLAFHKIKAGDVKTMRLIAWVTRDELGKLLKMEI